MSEKNAKSFLSMLQKSGIVPEDRLKHSLADLSKRAAGRTIGLDELSGHLIDAGLITHWHAEKLESGKYKGFFLGKYKLLGHLGTGGMSSVYLAEHTITRQKRALKVLPRKKVSDKSYFDRFYREGRAAASLSDPNVVRIYDICDEGDTHYMVMEYVQGKDLYEVVKDAGPLDYNLALDYTVQAAKGLQHAHDMKLVHRDVKPANLLLTDDHVVKILDLGLALLTEDEESLTVLHNERVMGTADYLAPEQAVNSHDVDHRADIYGLGCTLYFFLTGHPPFPNGSLAQRIAMHQTQEPVEITEDRPDCPVEIVALCKRMMKKTADDRFQTCNDVMKAISICRERIASAATIISGGSNDEAESSDLFGSEVEGVPGPTSSIRSAADVRTDEIAAANTLNFDRDKTATSNQQSEVVCVTEETKKPVAKPSQIKARAKGANTNQKKAAIWITAMIVAMLVLLFVVVVVAMQFAGHDGVDHPGQLPMLVQNGHDILRYLV